MTDDLKVNRRAAAELLTRFAEEALGHFVNGRAVIPPGATTFDNLSPTNGEKLSQVVAGDSAAIETACEAASGAFAEWRNVSGAKRKAMLHRVADAIEANARNIALVESADTGQPLRFMSKAAIRGAENFRYFADRAPAARDGLALPADDHLNYTTRQPIGPVGVITPWNTPFMLSTWKIAPALAAGLHRRAQAGRVEPADGKHACGNRVRGRTARRCAQRRSRGRRNRWQSADGAPRHQSRGVCRRDHHRIPHHATGCADAKACALRAGRQEPRDRVRRRRLGSRSGRGRVHDLQLERRALYVLESSLAPSVHL